MTKPNYTELMVDGTYEGGNLDLSTYLIDNPNFDTYIIDNPHWIAELEKSVNRQPDLENYLETTEFTKGKVHVNFDIFNAWAIIVEHACS